MNKLLVALIAGAFASIAGRGDGGAGNAAFGQALLEAESKALAEMIRSVKGDAVTLKLQTKFFDDAATPLETKPFVKK